MKTSSELINHCENALKENWQYVYGAKGKIYTKVEIKKLQERWGAEYVLDNDIETKGGKICCDCSGLISSLTGKIRNSQGYFDTATERKDINDRNASMKGWGVWMKGHIGIYDGNDGYYALDNSQVNIVHNPIKPNSFTYIINKTKLYNKLRNRQFLFFLINIFFLILK